MKKEEKLFGSQAKIKTAVYLVYASLILRILRTSLTTIGQKKLSEPGLLTVVFVGILLVCLIGYKIGHGKNWARIAFLILTMWDFISFPLFVRYFLATLIVDLPTFTMLTILNLAVQLYAVIIIFSGESKQWFTKPRTD